MWEYTHGHKEEWINAICGNMDAHIIILSEIRERQTSYNITYVWNIKKKFQMNLLTKETHKHRKQV